MGGVHSQRKAVVIEYDQGDYEGPVKIKTSNPDDPDNPSGTNLDSNQGFAALTFPVDHSGTVHVVVEDNAGNVLDEFDIEA